MNYLDRSGTCRNISHKQSDNDTAVASGLITTAIPVGPRWAVKIRSSHGNVTLPKIFDSRLPALGAAVLVSEQIGGRVLP